MSARGGSICGRGQAAEVLVTADKELNTFSSPRYSKCMCVRPSVLVCGGWCCESLCPSVGGDVVWTSSWCFRKGDAQFVAICCTVD